MVYSLQSLRIVYECEDNQKNVFKADRRRKSWFGGHAVRGLAFVSFRPCGRKHLSGLRIAFSSSGGVEQRGVKAVFLSGLRCEPEQWKKRTGLEHARPFAKNTFEETGGVGSG